MLATPHHAVLAPQRGKSLTRSSHCLDLEHQNWPAYTDQCARLAGYGASPRRELLSGTGAGSPRVGIGAEEGGAEAPRPDPDGAVGWPDGD
jgi:hypothetical protein